VTVRYLRSLCACAVAVVASLCAGAASPAAWGAQSQVAVEFALSSAWDGGFVTNVRLRNDGTTTVNGWTLAFTWSPQIVSHWNAILTTTPTGVSYRQELTPLEWNSTIAPGATVTVGFQANGTFTPTVTACAVNGFPVVPTYVSGPGGGGGTPIVEIGGVLAAADAFRIPPGMTTRALALSSGADVAAWSVRTNNPRVMQLSVGAAAGGGHELRLNALAPGFASITVADAGSGASRTVGVAVERPDASMPGFPAYLALGSVSEDIAAHLDYFRGYGPGAAGGNRFVDFRYIYINGGPVSGWRTWTAVPGDRARRYVRESKRLGMIPCFVFYNVPDSGESLATNVAHLHDPQYMAGYWRDLDLFCDLVREETADGWPVAVILEPDCLGYFAQAGYAPDTPAIAPRVDTAYSTAGFDGDPILAAGDPQFPNSIPGFVRAINHVLRRDIPSVRFGWQLNLWASPPGGFAGTPIPGNGICRMTDIYGIAGGRMRIRAEARAIAEWYVAAGVLSSNADFVSIDKYGLDAVGANPACAADPAAGPWFFNADHWHNYLAVVRSLHEATERPVVLWQIPVGRVNSTTDVDPAAGAPFAPLDNSIQRYEDSATTFFFGDTFDPGTATRRAWFATNAGQDPKVSTSGALVTWGEHLSDARDAGAIALMCGAGVGASTTNIPPSSGISQGPTDGGFWMRRAELYYLDPVPLDPQAPPPADLNGDGRINGLDLAMLLAAWGTRAADIDGNGTSDGADLAMVLASWTG
jgi:hypothetical protein